MATWRMAPPYDGASITVNGRVYTCAAGATIDVPDFDATTMQANGWIAASTGGVYTTATRPVNVPAGTSILDSTLNATIVFTEAGVWINEDTGAIV